MLLKIESSKGTRIGVDEFAGNSSMAESFFICCQKYIVTGSVDRMVNQKLGKKKNLKNKIAPETPAKNNRDVSDALKLLDSQPQQSEEKDATRPETVQDTGPHVVLSDQEYQNAVAEQELQRPPQDCWDWIFSKPPPPPKPWCMPEF